MDTEDGIQRSRRELVTSEVENATEAIDPSIDPKVLIDQGENAGNISDSEHGQGVIVKKDELGNAVFEAHNTVEGLPLIGAKADQFSREQLANASSEDKEQVNRLFDEQVKEGQFPNREEAEQWLYSERGMFAMVEEVKQRAKALVPNASEKLQDAIASQAAENFRNEFISKNAERQANFDAEAQALLDKLKGGAPISEILPEVSVPLVSETETVTMPETPPTSNAGDDTEAIASTTYQ